MNKPRKRAIFPVECICGCSEIFYTNRKNKHYKNASHKNRAYQLIHPRHKIGLRSVITLDEIRYGLVRLDTVKDGDILTLNGKTFYIYSTPK